jgi:hypothetical protein
VPDALFLGLVTHPATRFPESAGERGLVTSLARELSAAGRTSQVLISDVDGYSSDLLVIDRDQIAGSIDAELAIEGRWRRYLDPRIPAFALSAFMAVRRAYRRRRFLPAAGVEALETSPGFRMVRRLVNIELAHMSLIRAAAASGCAWTLIVEDDASCDDIPALAVALEGFMDAYDAAPQPLYVNVSRSFDQDKLRIGALLTEQGVWGPSPQGAIEVLTAVKPVTNTVCAVLYRTSFLVDLLAVLETIPLSPVIPIDWKLNTALLHLHDQRLVGSGDCWLLEPAPIVQRSMQITADAP